MNWASFAPSPGAKEPMPTDDEEAAVLGAPNRPAPSAAGAVDCGLCLGFAGTFQVLGVFLTAHTSRASAASTCGR